MRCTACETASFKGAEGAFSSASLLTVNISIRRVFMFWENQSMSILRVPYFLPTCTDQDPGA